MKNPKKIARYSEGGSTDQKPFSDGCDPPMLDAMRETMETQRQIELVDGG